MFFVGRAGTPGERGNPGLQGPRGMKGTAGTPGVIIQGRCWSLLCYTLIKYNVDQFMQKTPFFWNCC